MTNAALSYHGGFLDTCPRCKERTLTQTANGQLSCIRRFGCSYKRNVASEINDTPLPAFLAFIITLLIFLL